MSASVVASSCRLTIISSNLRVDLAVPLQLSVAELLTIVVSSLGRETADQGAAEGGWILQRPGEPPLDPGVTLAASQLQDGTTLHLRTRASHLPEVAFDDVLEAVATGVLTRTERWRPEHTMRAAAVMAGGLSAFALLMLLVSGPDRVLPTVVAGVGSLLFLLTAVAVGRFYRRRVPSLAAGGFAVAYAAVAGGIGVGGDRPLTDFGAPQLLVAAAAATLVATVLLAVLGTGYTGFVAVITTGVLLAIGTVIATATTLSAPATAAIVAAAALAVSPFLPALSFRLSRLPLPTVPQDAADLRQDTATVDSEQILAQSVRADAYLTGLIAGGAVAIAAAAVVIAGNGVVEEILALVLGVITLLRARLFSGRAQRVVLLTGGAVALLAVLVTAAAEAEGTTRLLAYVAPAIVVALVLVAFAVTLPGRRYSPALGRTADIIESLLVLSVIPLALAVMGVYGAARGLPKP